VPDSSSLVSSTPPAHQGGAYPRPFVVRLGRAALIRALIALGAYPTYVGSGLVMLIAKGKLTPFSFATIWNLLIGPIQPVATRYPVAYALIPILIGISIAGIVAKRDKEQEDKTNLADDAARIAADLLDDTYTLTVKVPQAFIPAAVPFIGRVSDKAALQAMLLDGGITVIHGVEGLGKTALVAEVVHALRDTNPPAFPNGMVFIYCGGRRNAQELLRTVLEKFAVLNEREVNLADLAALQAYTVRAMHGKRALIIFDNVSAQLPIGDVAGPLRESGITVVVTANVELALADARRFSIQPLSPDDALALFTVIYTDGATTHALTPQEQADAKKIIAALSRHTYAIRLAAAHARDTHDLAGLAQTLERNPVDLTDENGKALIRQMFTVAFGELDDTTSDLLITLAAFHTVEFSKNAVLAVAAAQQMDSVTTENGLVLLKRRALLDFDTIANMPQDSDRERVRLLSFIQALARERFDAWSAARRDLVLRALAAYYARYTTAVPDVECYILGTDERNINHIVEWAHTQQDDALVACLCWGMGHYWRDWGRTLNRYDFMPWGIEAARHLIAPQSDREQRLLPARLAVMYGDMLTSRGGAENVEKARKLFEEQLPQFQKEADLVWQGETLGSLAQVAEANERIDAAHAYYLRSLAAFKEANHPNGQCNALLALCDLAQDSGDFTAAAAYCQQALEIARARLPQSQELSVALFFMGKVRDAQGNATEAARYYEEGLASMRAIAYMEEEAKCLYCLRANALAQMDDDKASTFHQQYAAISLDGFIGPRVADSLLRFGRVLAEKARRTTEGAFFIKEAIRIYALLKHPKEQQAREVAQHLHITVS
jgi:tetratricopeptide (TPR) repeat protein